MQHELQWHLFHSVMLVKVECKFSMWSCAGCLENMHGFYPLRNQDSKWHISYEEMPDEVVRSLLVTYCIRCFTSHHLHAGGVALPDVDR